MFFSSKIPNSILSYFDREGISRELFYLHSEWPEEFLKDPSCWLDSRKLESFLGLVEKEVGDIEKVAHSCPRLNSWGPLDSVLKLMSRPQDILSQPARLLSYFISPPPPVDLMEQGDDFISFRIPISSEEYPLTTRYLKGAFECLPNYVGRPSAQVSWKENVVHISWKDAQVSLLSETEALPNPQLLQTLLMSLEKTQKELEEKNRELQQKNQELQAAQKQLEINLHEELGSVKVSGFAELVSVVSNEMGSPMSQVLKNVTRMQDYIVRAQQLITLIIGSKRMAPEVQQAMRKVDWEHLVNEFPIIVKGTVDEIYRIQDALSDLSSQKEVQPDDKLRSPVISLNNDQLLQ